MKIYLLCLLCVALASGVFGSPHIGYHYDRSAAGLSASSGNKDNHNFLNAAPAISNALFAPAAGRGEPGRDGEGYSGDKYLPPASTTAAPIITKQFYLVSAPEETDTVSRTKHFVIGRPQKNYRVVFIKAPAPENANLKLTAEYAPQEEKTVIYVLSKKDNEVNVGEIDTPTPTQPTKPEVFFIKYKTPEEAQAAQKEIQDQYDQLGGTSEFSDEGVVPVKSVVGSLDGLAANGGYDYKRGQNGQPGFKDFLQQMRYFF